MNDHILMAKLENGSESVKVKTKFLTLLQVGIYITSLAVQMMIFNLQDQIDLIRSQCKNEKHPLRF